MPAPGLPLTVREEKYLVYLKISALFRCSAAHQHPDPEPPGGRQGGGEGERGGGDLLPRGQRQARGQDHLVPQQRGLQPGCRWVHHHAHTV